MSALADDQYEQQNDTVPKGVPAGDKMDNDYASRTGQSQIPVQKDDAPVEDPIDPASADSDQMLGKSSVPSVSCVYKNEPSLMMMDDCSTRRQRRH